MSFNETWSKSDIRFLKQTYPDTAWQPRQIARKLGMDVNRVYHKAHYLGLSRPTRRRLDWSRIAELHDEGLGPHAIAYAMNCSCGAVQGALRAMAEREVAHG